MTLKKLGTVIIMIMMIILLVFIRGKVMENKMLFDKNNKISSYN